jgi:predicted aspartyl protease
MKVQEAIEMGEVRVQVKLINSGDEVLVRRGLMTPEQVRSYTTDGLVDTGGVVSTLPLEIVDRLGLSTTGKATAQYANGSEESVDLTEVVGFVINDRRTTEEALVLGNEVLIGQTVLERLDLLVDPVNRQLIPNPAHPNEPVLKIK